MDDRHARKFQKELNAGLVALVLLAVLDASSEDLYGYEIAKRLQRANEGEALFKEDRSMNPSAPRSIDDYLHALRAALAGADPALIQDALYDAEEHLRAEAAANPGNPRRNCSNISRRRTARRTKWRRPIATRKRRSQRRCSRRSPEGFSRRTCCVDSSP